MRGLLSLNKKMIWVSLASLCLLLSLLLMHKTYAGKPFISLDSPVSFPVDI